MYRTEIKIDNVKAVKCVDNNLFYNIKGFLICQEKELLINVEGNSFWILPEGYIYYHTEDGERFYNHNGRKCKVEYPFFVNTFQNEYVFCKINFRRENRKWKWELGRFNLVKGNLVDSYQISDFTIESVLLDRIIGYYQKNEIWALYSNDLNRVAWKVDFNSCEIVKNLGLWQEHLIIACTNHLLLSIDINTGKILKEWNELKGFEAGQEYKDVIPEPSDFVLDKEIGKLIGVFSKYYFEIDLETGEVTYDDIRENLKRYCINSFRRMGSNPFTKDHLFVTAHAELEERPNVDLDCVLALNRNTKEVDWIHVFKDTGLGTNVPQITDTHLYQLDTEGTLYIFKKEIS